MFRKTLVARAMAIAFGTAVVSIAMTDVAQAQSNATATIYGTSPAGADSIVFENVGTNARRSVTPEANGRFTITSLPPGRYRVIAMKGTAVVATTQVEGLLGQGAEASFGTAATSLGRVQVVGARQVIDTTSTQSSTTFTAAELATLPIAQNVTSILLLAPDTVRADPRYAGGASIGGGAPSENAYYINGFPVTNPLSQLGSIELPYSAISQAQILTGGYGAEFGRSTGGVVNITTKSGTNTWSGGVDYYIEPDNLRSTPKNIYYPKTGAAQNATTDGQLYIQRADDRRTETKLGAYIGGPLIEDRLFFFAAVDRTRTMTDGVEGSVLSSTLGANGWESNDFVDRRYLLKIDANITDTQHLEYTGIGDKYSDQETNYGYSYTTLSRTTGPTYSASYKNIPNITSGVGGFANIVKYTGNFFEDLTVTALYGESRSPHDQTYSGLGNGLPPGVTFNTATAHAPGINYGTAQPLSGVSIPPEFAEDKTKSGRFDLEYVFAPLNMTLRAGLDKTKLTSASAGEEAAGGSTYLYIFTTTPGTVRHFGPYSYVVANGSPLGNAGYYVRQRTFSDATDARSDQTSQYVEDRWNITKDILVTAGVRNESFSGYNQDNDKYIKSNNFISPRLAAAWDVLSDQTLKLFGNLGRYSIQTPTHVAVRGAGTSTLVDQYFTYTGSDRFGNPTGLTPLTAAPFSPDGETGQSKDPNSVAAKNLKPSYQDEAILGLDKQIMPTLTVGIKGTYRELKNTLDDICDERPFDAYADAHGINRDNYSFSCLESNPGRTNKYLVDYAGTGSNYTTVKLGKSDFGFNTPKRTYMAIDLYAEHPFSDGWYGRLTYTFSHNRGNTEGQTKSDNGQTDVSATSTWDFHEIMENSYGYLPNDRKHAIKAIGTYQFLPEWFTGANLELDSGRPKNCIGNYGGDSPDGDYGGYGSIFFYCGGEAAPRGSAGRLPWEMNLDWNLIYSPNWLKGAKFRVDIFNLVNRQSAEAIDEIHENANDPSSVRPQYGRVIQYTAPRTVRLSAQYDF